MYIHVPYTYTKLKNPGKSNQTNIFYASLENVGLEPRLSLEQNGGSWILYVHMHT